MPTDLEVIPNAETLGRLLGIEQLVSNPTARFDPFIPTVVWTAQLVSISARLPNGAPYAVTKPLPITYGQLRLLSQAIGFTIKE